jgi:hypothetical protein
MASTHGLPRGRDGPPRLDLQRAGIQSDYLVGVFEIAVDHSLAIGDGLLGSAAEWNGRYHGSASRVDNRRALGLTIEANTRFDAGS